MEMVETGTARGHWDSVGEQWGASRPDRLWRQCSDLIHYRWLEQDGPWRSGTAVLKTDLFDEANATGLLPWFETRGIRATGCDLAWPTANQARRRGTAQDTVIADVRRLPFRECFEAVVSNSTLDHFAAGQEIVDALREIHGAMRPGGRLYITMDNPRHPLIRLRSWWPRLWRRLGLVPYETGVTCSAARLKTVLEQAGFVLEHAGSLMHSPRVLIVLLCRFLARVRGLDTPPALLVRALLAFESLAGWPTWEWTGHFVAAVARKETSWGSRG